MASPTQKKPSGGSFGSSANYNRMVSTYAPAPAAPPAPSRPPQGFEWGEQPPASLPPVSDAVPFTAAGAFNKAGLLGLVAMAVGAMAYLADLPVAIAYVAMFAGLGIGIWCSVRPRRAPVLAPVFAVLEGAVLGIITRFYTDLGNHIVTMAVVGTLTIVVGVWFCYRTGWVRVSRKFVQTTVVITLGMLAVMMVAIFTGWGTSGISGFMIFGVLYLVIAVMNLFVDCAFVYQAQSAGLPAEAEWFSAFSILVSSVMVYLALLRMLGGRR